MRRLGLTGLALIAALGIPLVNGCENRTSEETCENICNNAQDCCTRYSYFEEMPDLDDFCNPFYCKTACEKALDFLTNPELDCLESTCKLSGCYGGSMPDYSTR